MDVKKTTAGIAAGLTMIGGGSLVVDSQMNPYNTVGNTLQVQTVSTIPQEGSEKIIVDKTQPKITMEKFNGEVALGIKYNGITSTGDRPFLSKNVTWTQDATQSMEAVPIDATSTMEDGGMEININLNSKPATNVFTFQLSNWQNLDFFYQPALTAQEIKEGATRPDNVVGSYAVYYKNHSNHITGQTNYATGKAYHIFRPLVTDKNGATVWASMSYANGILTVTVPQSFLDSAVYPVKVDPTFGYTTQGASDINLTNSSFTTTFADRADAISGTLTSVSAYIKASGANCVVNGCLVALSVYSHNSGTSKPNARIVGSSSFAVGGTSYTLQTQSLSTSLSNTTYWAVAEGANDGFTVHELLAYDVGTNTPNYGASNESDIGTWALDSNNYSVYATYTSTPTPTSSINIINQATEIINNATVIIP